MNGPFLTSLLSFYEEDPTDPFNVYALAIEYAKSDPVQAERFFEILLTQHPDYLPTYYHAGAFFAAMERVEKTEQIYRKGVELARSRNDAKALRELMGAYNAFLDELDD